MNKMFEILDIPMKYQKAKDRRSKIWAEKFKKANGDKTMLKAYIKGDIIHSMKYLNDDLRKIVRDWIYE